MLATYYTFVIAYRCHKILPMQSKLWASVPSQDRSDLRVVVFPGQEHQVSRSVSADQSDESEFDFIWRSLVMKCPACDSDLQMSERSGVAIDYCPGCRGVWLDRGELDKIVERSGRDTEGGRLAADRERHYCSSEASASQQVPHPKKRESFWSELFDFG